MSADQVDENGYGVGDFDDHRVHAWGLLPGEAGAVLIEHVSPHKRQAWGRLAAGREAASPHRVEPICAAFGDCGGCAWQHLSEGAQLEHKRARVQRALDAALDPAPTVRAVVPAPSRQGYRNRGKYVVGRTDGGTVLGAYRPRSHTIVDTVGCRVVDPMIDAQAVRLRAALDRSSLTPFDEATREGTVRYAILRAGANGDVLMVLVTTSDADRSQVVSLAQGLAADPAVSGVVWMRNDKRSGALLSDDLEVLFGRGTVTERFADFEVQVGSRGFLQVNRAAAATMYARLAAEVGAAGTVLDLYCGVGAIGFHLAGCAERVVGVDSNREAVQTARAATGPRTDLVFEHADAARVGALMAELAADVVVVNPPRKGLSRETRKLLLEHTPERIVYLSCGPETLARDLVELTGGGYQIDLAQPFDLMPGTAQVETLLLCSRKR